MHTLISKDEIEEKCLRCNEIKMWEHIIKCAETISMRKEFATNWLKEIIEYKCRDIDANKIFWVIEDTLWYAENKEDEECKRNQVLIGIEHFWRVYNWGLEGS